MLKKIALLSLAGTVCCCLLLLSACELPNGKKDAPIIPDITVDKTILHAGENVTLTAPVDKSITGEITYKWVCSTGSLNPDNTQSVIWNTPTESSIADISVEITYPEKKVNLTKKLYVLSEESGSGIPPHPCHFSAELSYDTAGIFHYYPCIYPGCTNVYDPQPHGFTYGKLGNKHVAVCNECGYDELQEHDIEYTPIVNMHDEHCTKCEYTQLLPHNPVTYHNPSIHWEMCYDCEKPLSGPTTHSLVQRNNSTHHWDECTGCAYKTVSVSHNMSTQNNSSGHWEECTSCGYTQNSSSHSFSGNHDSSSHWEECSCGYKRNNSSHSISCYYDSSSHWMGCSSCSYTYSNESHSYESPIYRGSDSEYYYYDQTCLHCGYTYSYKVKK